MFAKDKWCNLGHIHVKEQRCSRDIELLAVSIWPYYLQFIAIMTYNHPLANNSAASEPLSFRDSIHLSPTSTTTGTAASGKTTLWACCIQTQQAPTAIPPLPPLGCLDHNLRPLSESGFTKLRVTTKTQGCETLNCTTLSFRFQNTC